MLTGRSVETPAQTLLADLLLAWGAEWVLIKGGHGDGDAVDYLKSRDGRDFTYTAARDDNLHTHGTGCTLASAAGQPACASAALSRRRWSSPRPYVTRRHRCRVCAR